MHLHPETWGHVSYATNPPENLEATEEEQETLMLSCRYGRTPFRRSLIKLCRMLEQPHGTAFNPNTIGEVEEIFRRYLDNYIAQ